MGAVQAVAAYDNQGLCIQAFVLSPLSQIAVVSFLPANVQNVVEPAGSTCTQITAVGDDAVCLGFELKEETQVAGIAQRFGQHFNVVASDGDATVKTA